MFDLLAILGRGIQMVENNTSPSEISSWKLTEDLEVCDERSGHLPVRVPADDDSPYCMVGGGSLNLQAGINFMHQYLPKVLVFAYGDRSDYLKSVNGPTESEVMSKAFMHDIKQDPDISSWCLSRLPQQVIVIWPRTRIMSGPSNTGQELKNIFELAVERQLERIAVVTISVHVPRTATYVAKHLSVHEEWRHLRVTVFESEEVLLRANEDRRPQIEALRNSKSFARSWEREAAGISKIVRDVYGDAKPMVTKI